MRPRTKRNVPFVCIWMLGAPSGGGGSVTWGLPNYWASTRSVCPGRDGPMGAGKAGWRGFVTARAACGRAGGGAGCLLQRLEKHSSDLRGQHQEEEGLAPGTREGVLRASALGPAAGNFFSLALSFFLTTRRERPRGRQGKTGRKEKKGGGRASQTEGAEPLHSLWDFRDF